MITRGHQYGLEVLGHWKQLPQNKFFYLSSSSIRNIDDGEKKCENSGQTRLRSKVFSLGRLLVLLKYPLQTLKKALKSEKKLVQNFIDPNLRGEGGLSVSLFGPKPQLKFGPS